MPASVAGSHARSNIAAPRAVDRECNHKFGSNLGGGRRGGCAPPVPLLAGPRQGDFGSSGEQFGGHFGMSWDTLGALWGHCGVTLGRLGLRLGDLGTLQGHFGDHIVPEHRCSK